MLTQPQPPGRWEFLRDLAAFEVKLLLDGLRDLLMSPIALVAGIAGLLAGGDHPGRWFYQVLAHGRRSEAWINLFGAAVHAEESQEPLDGGVDTLVERLEVLLVEQVNRGGMTAQARDAIDRVLDKTGRR